MFELKKHILVSKAPDTFPKCWFAEADEVSEGNEIVTVGIYGILGCIF